MNNGSKERLTYGKRPETAFFTMTKGDFAFVMVKFAVGSISYHEKSLFEKFHGKNEENVQTVAS